MEAVPHALDEDFLFALSPPTALPRPLSPVRPRGPKAEAGWLDSSLDLQRGLTVQELPLPADDPAWRMWFAPERDRSRS